MNKNVEQAHGKLFYAVVTPFKGVGEDKLILHEATITPDGGFSYGGGDIMVIEPSTVIRIDREFPVEMPK